MILNYPMSRYTIKVEKLGVNTLPIHGKDYFEVIYGFDTGGLLGAESPLFGFFLQAWRYDECGNPEMTYHESGGKSAIVESPFWDDIQKANPEHAMAIVLDTIF